MSKNDKGKGRISDKNWRKTEVLGELESCCVNVLAVHKRDWGFRVSICDRGMRWVASWRVNVERWGQGKIGCRSGCSTSVVDGTSVLGTSVFHKCFALWFHKRE